MKSSPWLIKRVFVLISLVGLVRLGLGCSGNPSKNNHRDSKSEISRGGVEAGGVVAVAMVLSGAHVITLEVLTSQNPNTIAAVIAQNFPEAYGLKTNQLIAGGLVLFLITLLVNAVARLIISRYKEFSGAN